MATSTLDFAAPASDAELDALAERLRERNFEVVIVEGGEEAKAEVLKRIPEGARVHTGKSKTLEDAGLFQERMEHARCAFVRRTTLKLDQRTQRDEARNLGDAPAVVVHGPP